MYKKRSKRYKKGYCIYLTSCPTGIRYGRYKFGRTVNFNCRVKPYRTAFLGEEPILIYQRFVCEGDSKGLALIENTVKYLLRERNINIGKRGNEWYCSFRVQELIDIIDQTCDLFEKKSVPKQTFWEKAFGTLGLFSLKNAVFGYVNAEK